MQVATPAVRYFFVYSSHTKTTASLLILQISAYAVTSPRNGYTSRYIFLPEDENINAEQTSNMFSSPSFARQESQQKTKGCNVNWLKTYTPRMQ